MTGRAPPPHPLASILGVNRPTEADIDAWFGRKAVRSGRFVAVIPKMRMVDVHGDLAVADYGLIGAADERGFVLAVELKQDPDGSSDAADGFGQAMAYRDLCLVTDQRIPLRLRNRSPDLAFAGLFIDGARKHHKDNIYGMSLLAAKFGVGLARFCLRTEQFELHLGDARLFTWGLTDEVFHNDREDRGKFIFGKRKRQGRREPPLTTAEAVALKLQINLPYELQ